MRERHGDPMTDGTLPEIAMEAVHNDRRIRLLEHELSLLSDLAGRPKPNRRQIGAVAKRLIGGKTPRQLRPNDYLVAERKDRQDVVEGKGVPARVRLGGCRIPQKKNK